MTRTYRYIPIEAASDWLEVGWLIVADLGPYHGQFSLLGEWKCKCPVVEPGEKPDPPSFVDRPFWCPV